MPTFSWAKPFSVPVDKLLSYFCFIDDIDMKWNRSDENIDNFKIHANDCQPIIKFIMQSTNPMSLMLTPLVL